MSSKMLLKIVYQKHRLKIFFNTHKRKLIQRKQPEVQPIHAEKQLQWAQKYANYAPSDLNICYMD